MKILVVSVSALLRHFLTSHLCVYGSDCFVATSDTPAGLTGQLSQNSYDYVLLDLSGTVKLEPLRELRAIWSKSELPVAVFVTHEPDREEEAEVVELGAVYITTAKSTEHIYRSLKRMFQSAKEKPAPA